MHHIIYPIRELLPVLPPVVEGMWLYVVFYIQIQQHNLANNIYYCLQVHAHVMATDTTWSYALAYLQNHSHRLHQFETFLLLFP